MKKVLISGIGKVEKINVLDLLKNDVKVKQTESKTEQIRIKTKIQLENQTDQKDLDIEQERSF